MKRFLLAVCLSLYSASAGWAKTTSLSLDVPWQNDLRFARAAEEAQNPPVAPLTALSGDNRMSKKDWWIVGGVAAAVIVVVILIANNSSDDDGGSGGGGGGGVY